MPSAEVQREPPGLVVDILERLGPYLEPDAIDAETASRLREVVTLVDRKTASRG